MMKRIDIHEELLRQGFDVGYSTVCNYIRLTKNQQTIKEAFIRQVYLPGDVCEFDWGEIKLIIKGKRITLQLAVFTSAYSNYRYAFIYSRQDVSIRANTYCSYFR